MNWKKTVELYLQVGHAFEPTHPGEDAGAYIKKTIATMQLSEKSDLLCALFSKQELDMIKALGSEAILLRITEAVLRHHLLESFEFIRGLCHG